MENIDTEKSHFPLASATLAHTRVTHWHMHGAGPSGYHKVQNLMLGSTPIATSYNHYSASGGNTFKVTGCVRSNA